MQEKSENTLYLAKVLGELIRELRVKNAGYVSRNQFAAEYDLDDSNLSKIERGIIEAKFVTVYKIAQSLNMSFSDFIIILENKLGKDFTLVDT